MIKNVLITGGGGFLGSHLAEYFLKQNQRIICVDNFCTGWRPNKSYLESIGQKNLFFVEADVTQEWDNWISQVPPNILTDVTHVFHLASAASPCHYQRLPLETMWANSRGLQFAIEQADRLGAKVVFASTSEIYGDPHTSPQKESDWGNVNSFGPRACYDESKRFGEALIYSSNQKNKSRHGLVRIFNTYGPRMHHEDGRVIVNFMKQVIAKKDLTIYGSGRQTRSFCYVSDLIEGLVQYARKDLDFPVNLGNDQEISILELVDLLRKKIFIDQKISIVHQPPVTDEPVQRCPDLALARKHLAPWTPKVSLQDGLLLMRDWLLQ